MADEVRTIVTKDGIIVDIQDGEAVLDGLAPGVKYGYSTDPYLEEGQYYDVQMEDWPGFRHWLKLSVFFQIVLTSEDPKVSTAAAMFRVAIEDADFDDTQAMGTRLAELLNFTNIQKQEINDAAESFGIDPIIEMGS